MITVRCTHCLVRRHAPCAQTCKLGTHSDDVRDVKPEPKDAAA